MARRRASDFPGFVIRAGRLAELLASLPASAVLQCKEPCLAVCSPSPDPKADRLVPIGAIDFVGERYISFQDSDSDDLPSEAEDVRTASHPSSHPA